VLSITLITLSTLITLITLMAKKELDVRALACALPADGPRRPAR
jgi:hypothetical protein